MTPEQMKRHPARAPRTGTDTFPDEQVIWLRIGRHQFTIFEKDDDFNREDVPSLMVKCPSVFSLSSLTVEELDALRKFWNTAIDHAEPLCALLDQLALEEWENGNDAQRRMYHAVPQFVVRKRRQSRNAAGLPDGPSEPAEPQAERSGDEP